MFFDTVFGLSGSKKEIPSSSYTSGDSVLFICIDFDRLHICYNGYLIYLYRTTSSKIRFSADSAMKTKHTTLLT
jgi:hypothetical protein